MTTQESENWREKANDEWSGKKYRDREWLRERYVSDEMSGGDIAEICGVGEDTIYKWLKKHEIDTRGRNEKRKNWIDPSDDLVESLEGGLLGDGYMGRQNDGGGAYYQEADTNRAYLKWLCEYYSELGLDGWVGHTPKNIGADWRFTSIKVMDLVDVWRRWYRSGEKRIPDGFEISPTKILFWYVGDGYLSESHGEPVVAISGYDLADRFDMVAEQLEAEGITCSVFEQGIRIWSESHDEFFNYLSQSKAGVPDGYAYKFDI
jgi:hypothetical protein